MVYLKKFIVCIIYWLSALLNKKTNLCIVLRCGRVRFRDPRFEPWLESGRLYGICLLLLLWLGLLGLFRLGSFRDPRFEPWLESCRLYGICLLLLLWFGLLGLFRLGCFLDPCFAGWPESCRLYSSLFFLFL